MSTKKICTQCGAEYGPEQKFCSEDGSALRIASTDDPLIGQVIGDRYLITGLVGEGGMGRVYVAEHVRMGRKSALKVMSPALANTADAITRFNREASNASRINHPNVAAIFDFGETTTGLLYIAMEFVEGDTLRALIQRQGPLPVARAAQITKGIADALTAAHQLGIIHRDLKPDNIMVTRQLDGSDWVKVVDFGIAKSVATGGLGGGGQTVTTAGVSLGTPEYMSPEQLAGEQLDHHTDTYSLGLVLFNMLTGDLPYPKLTSKETLVRRLTTVPATLAEVRPDIVWPAAVQAVLTRALEPERDRRYASVADLGRAIVAAAALPAVTDPDATLRVAPLAVPAMGATSAHRPPAATDRPSTPTRPLPRARSRGAGRTLLTAATLLVVAVVTYAAQARKHSPLASPPIAATRDSAAKDSAEKDSAAKDSAAVSKAKPPTIAAASATPVVPPKPPSTGSPVVPTSVPARHPWLTPNGDSVAVSGDSTRQTLTKALGEIRGHMQRAGRFVAQGQLPKAAQEMRDGQSEAKALRQAALTAKLPVTAERQLRQLGAQAVRSCYATAEGAQAAVQRCRDFQERQARAARGRATGTGGSTSGGGPV